MVRRKRKSQRRQVHSITVGYPPTVKQSYDPAAYPPDEVYKDTVVSVLGPPIEGWVFELVYRYAIYRGLNVDWAIMIWARHVDDGVNAVRRPVQRIDICHSEVHSHEFLRSSNPTDEQGERNPIVSLTANDAVTVSREWDEQMALLSREWPARVRRWIDG
jgi:hypothetical protein